MTDQNSNLANLRNDQDVIQDILNRLDIVEKTPSLQQQAINDYIRNFDSLEHELKVMNDARQSYLTQINKWCRYTVDEIKKVNIVFDADTINGLKDFVEQKTNFSLQDYISDIQIKAINGNFKTFNNKVDSMNDKLQIALDELNELHNAYEYLLNRYRFFAVALITLIGISVLIAIPSYINAFGNHPILTLIIVLGFIVSVVYTIAKMFGDDDDNES